MKLLKDLWKMIKEWYVEKTANKDYLPPKKELGKALEPVSETPWMTIAQKEIGQKEILGASDNKRIVEYHSATTLKATDDETPWCSAFVCWCLEQAKVKSTRSAWARSYLKWGRKLDKPKYGCIAVFERGTNAGHVAFFVDQDTIGDRIRVLGGNQDNSVSIKYYPTDRLLGYRWPL